MLCVLYVCMLNPILIAVPLPLVDTWRLGWQGEVAEVRREGTEEG